MIKLKIRSKRSAYGKRKGQVLYFAHQCPTPRTSLEDIAQRIQSATALSMADVRSCIIALGAVATEELAQGRAVDLGELGRLRPTVGAQMVETPEEVTAHTVRTPRVSYRPSPRLRQAVESNSISIEREP